MARKTALSTETLIHLSHEKLVQLVLDQAQQNKAFRRIVEAALAGNSGTDAVVKVIDRRLKELGRSKSFIDWTKIREFRDNLRSISAIIIQELGSRSPSLTVEWLLRFVVTHEKIFERIDDSYGIIQGCYEEALERLDEFCEQLSDKEKEENLDLVLSFLMKDSYGYGYYSLAAQKIVSYLSDELLLTWEKKLSLFQGNIKESGEKGWNSKESELRSIRQAIAQSLNDMELLVTLEQQKLPHMQNTLFIAQCYYENKNFEEALLWVRKNQKDARNYLASGDLHDFSLRSEIGKHPALLEARILDELKKREEAQKLRWHLFEKSLSAYVLREYIQKLADFEEFEELDKAFQHVLESQYIYSALDFLLEWPRYDLASQFILKHAEAWDGIFYDFMKPAAEKLEHDYPTSASILYRALLDKILMTARSKAYSHAASYLKKLDELSHELDLQDLREYKIADHTIYMSRLETEHKRKTAFWTLTFKK